MMEIHGVPVSVHTRKVIIAAIEKGLEHRNAPVIPFDPPPGWARTSPTGKIPVLVDGDGWLLRDSSAICAYFERLQPAPSLYPAQARDYAEALWLEEYADGTLFRDVVHGLFFQKVIRPLMLKQPCDAETTKSILDQSLPPVFGYLESVLQSDFLVGGQFSIADVATVSNLVNFHYLGYEIDAGAFPKLAAYFRHQLARRAVAKALAAEQPVARAMGLDTGFVHYLALAAT